MIRSAVESAFKAFNVDSRTLTAARKRTFLPSSTAKTFAWWGLSMAKATFFAFERLMVKSGEPIVIFKFLMDFLTHIFRLFPASSSTTISENDH